jgi:hypothetical protein
MHAYRPPPFPQKMHKQIQGISMQGQQGPGAVKQEDCDM